MMTNTEFVQQVNASLTIFHGGSLRIWGQWFGRPHDNIHRIVSASSTSDHVKVSFDQGETSAVWNPAGLKITTKAFTVKRADRVRWEWYYYGRPPTPENLYYEDYVNQGYRITATTNVDWYIPNLRPRRLMAAIKLT